MPLGLNRTDLNDTGITYKDGTPITEPHDFGNDVDWATPNPAHFGNPIPTSGTEQNKVTWATLDPTHFGNIFGGAGGMTFNRFSGTGYDNTTPPSDLAQPGDEFEMTWSIPNPPGGTEDPGFGWFVTVDVHYKSGAVDITIPMKVEYFNLVSGGGYDISVTYLGHDYIWEVFSDDPNFVQMYSGTDADPTLIEGTYVTGDGAFGFDGGAGHAFNTIPYAVSIGPTSYILQPNSLDSKILLGDLSGVLLVS